MARATVHLPGLLAPFAGGVRTVPVEADTLGGALDDLVRHHPALKVHLFDESGGFRRHVLCFHNAENTRWLENLDGRLAPGDEITILQAVSGGA
jgi:molybdopterin converting factor small subunit